MIENIKVTILGKQLEIPKGFPLEEIAKQVQSFFSYPIILAKVNGILKELRTKIEEDATIEFLDLTTREGNRAHVNGLTFLLIYAVKELYGADKNIIVQHSLDKGLYIESTFPIDHNKILEIKNKMIELVKEDLDIYKVTVDRIEAISYFKKIKDEAKAEIMKYNTNTFVTLYRLGNLYNYFYYDMPISTKVLKDFDLNYVSGNGFMLRFPTIYIHDKIKEYEHHPNMFKVFQECKDWAKLMHVTNASELNKVISNGKIGDLIRMNEMISSNRLFEIARDIKNRPEVKIILLAGPTSSGKTTTTKKLCMYLQSLGLTPKVISMDNYFVDKKDTPVDKEGNPDYECLEAIDLKLFDQQIAQLIAGENVVVPTYNFFLGRKEFLNTMSVGKNDLILIEGIHGLDPKILGNIQREQKYKIYLSALTELNMDDHNRISTTDNRLLRRIIRDYQTRGYSVLHTLENWDSVRKGEEKYIFPYQDDADATFNTALIYELSVLKTYVEPLLYSIEQDSKHYEEAKRLINVLKLFLPIPSENIPSDSIIREFIGGSCFYD